jgi:hypothetical protein
MKWTVKIKVTREIVIEKRFPTIREDWAANGHKRNRFPPKYDVRIKGNWNIKNKPDEIYEQLLDDNICKLITEDTNICAEQNM